MAGQLLRTRPERVIAPSSSAASSSAHPSPATTSSQRAARPCSGPRRPGPRHRRTCHHPHRIVATTKRPTGTPRVPRPGARHRRDGQLPSPRLRGLSILLGPQCCDPRASGLTPGLRLDIPRPLVTAGRPSIGVSRQQRDPEQDRQRLDGEVLRESSHGSFLSWGSTSSTSLPPGRSAADAALLARPRPQRLGGHLETAVVAPRVRVKRMKIQSRRLGFGTQRHHDDEPDPGAEPSARETATYRGLGHARSVSMRAASFVPHPRCERLFGDLVPVAYAHRTAWPSEALVPLPAP